VTGSSRGIGRAVALRLAREGARVVVNYRCNARAAREVAEQIAGFGFEPDPLLVSADVRRPEDVTAMFAAVRDRYGRLDVLVNNAALGGFGPLMRVKRHIWDLTMEASARPLLLCSQEAATLMKDGGRIISISSCGSKRYVPNYGPMGAAKACMEALSRYLAVEMAPRGIVVNVIAGGLIETDTLQFIPESDKLREHARSKTPLGRLGRPDDIAGVVAWLCGPDAAWICGQVIVVDGGRSLV
jgi:enoyl-[acyl-carrier protein] reductase III